MGSIFVAPGTNAANQRSSNQQTAASDANSLLSTLYPGLQQEANYSTSQIPGQEAAQTRALFLASPGNTEARQNLVDQQAQSTAAAAGRQADAMDNAAGISGAYTAGNNDAIENQAVGQENAYTQQMNSPQGQAAMSNALMQQYQNAMGLPSSGAWQQMVGDVYNQPQVQVGEGLGQVLGGIAGSAASDYLGGGFGGGGGGGGNVSYLDGSGGWSSGRQSLPTGFPYAPSSGYGNTGGVPTS